jgi:hypothetical protein
MESELSPEKQQLLKHVVGAQEQALNGCETIFRGLRHSPDPLVSSIAEQAIEALESNRAILEALIDGLTSTKH